MGELERDLRYSHRAIHSPEVPVFRDDTGALLDHPYRPSMITAAAPNLTAIRANQPDLAESVPAVVRARALRVLQVTAAHGHRRLVLGAWGCVFFGNDPGVVADAFATALRRVSRFVQLDPKRTSPKTRPKTASSWLRSNAAARALA